jgi:hypothetical protein
VSAAALLAAFTAGCGSSSGTPKAAAGSDMARYVQTWNTDYDHTICTQWGSQMSDQQRWTAAFELLRDNRRSDASIVKLPSDALVNRFKDDLATRCASGAAGQTAISDIASDAYLAGRSGYRS